MCHIVTQQRGSRVTEFVSLGMTHNSNMMQSQQGNNNNGDSDGKNETKLNK